MTLNLMGGVKQEITEFPGGLCEEALCHVQLFWNLEEKFQYRFKITKFKQVKKAQEEAQGLVQDDDSNASETCKNCNQRIMDCVFVCY